MEKMTVMLTDEAYSHLGFMFPGIPAGGVRLESGLWQVDMERVMYEFAMQGLPPDMTLSEMILLTKTIMGPDGVEYFRYRFQEAMNEKMRGAH